jgi:NADH-ubiquinone oxidoreductase chain 5
MAFSLTILSFGSLFSGYLLKDAFVGMGNFFWGNSIYKLDSNAVGLDLEFIPLFIKNLPLIFSLFGIFLGILLNYILDLFKNIKYTNKNNYDNLIVFYPQNFYIFL